MKRIATLTAAIALMLPGSALAATNSSTCQAYNPQTCVVTDSSPTNGGGTANATTADSSATLPFTGMDVVLIAAGGGTLVGGGLVLRRLTQREN